MRRPSHATVVAYLALFAALGGGAYAAATIDSGDIVNKTIKGKDVKPNKLTGKQVNEAKLRLPQLRVGTGDLTATSPDVILSYPKLGIQIETDGDADDDFLYFMRNIGTSGNITHFVETAAGSATVMPGGTSGHGSADAVRDFVVARTTDHARAVHFNCLFSSVTDEARCVGIDVKP